jgi:dTDP-4-dehydrorhamnose 3,5-epimerase
VIKTPIEQVRGAYFLTVDRHFDRRGYFQEVFARTSHEFCIAEVLQTNVSCSRKNVVRGLHVASFSKLCTVVRGKVFDVVADVRKGSPTEGQWFGTYLDDENRRQLFVPAGCAHGFLVYEDDTLFLYQQNGLYDPKTEWTIHWKDPILNINWPEAEYYSLSDKDRDAKEWTR